MWWLDLEGAVHPFDRERFKPMTEPSAAVWMTVEDDPAWLPDEALAHVEAIAIEFPKFTDGRPFSLATILRARGWHGPLFAVGHFLLDQLDYLRRCGFTGFAPDPERYPYETLCELGPRLLRVFTEPYQASSAVPQPLWLRVRRDRAEQPVSEIEV
ncbi:DUF934 domain-containing protein [Hydrogenophilus thermoluteolus]|uniref:Oxidoreductase n=1 Tax=Hydrogenophilus thermoluteolus TaxID=297 RepID=A0A2Z6DXN8_HYDTE|nr:DUF934 domain-containing protein [Hydrogenophilus thermoluteolus]MBW7656744.1 DUF934 domain-containing protein [Hydrogenophilus thermoluteolus]BBD77089.1 hypothetical protein HPTL_0821 [Hydrogenophilus thermoluteolus]GLW60127.1 hypothetical protein Hthe01_04760 [Hydrogenophilus thermoluteolus]HNQ48471.1 DUF934 domain-containing protein [Hydrogenophilus thermoluteolus]HNU20008.1 DUF934 domain-containing protein [Hydrogenophilus thermoluteolus]